MQVFKTNLTDHKYAGGSKAQTTGNVRILIPAKAPFHYALWYSIKPPLLFAQLRRLVAFLSVTAAVFVLGIIWLQIRHSPLAAPEPPRSANLGAAGFSQSTAFSTYFGGSDEDTIRDIVTDSAGNIYIAGGTASLNFPTTPGAYDTTPNGWMDAFVAKLDSKGNLIWCTLIGGPGYDRVYAIEVDGQGYVYITGRAGPGFPVTPGAFQTTFEGYYTGTLYGNENAFIAKLKPDGSALVWASYFGPVQGNRDLALDADGNIYIATGSSTSETSSFPSSWFTNAYQKTRKGPADSVIAEIKSDGTQVLWATFFGGSGTEGSTPSIRVDASGNPVILSGTNSTDLPVSATAFDQKLGGAWDMYSAKFSSDGSSLVFATYLGGSGIEFSETHGLALDTLGNVIVAATTNSSDFPTTAGAFQRTYGGSGGNGTGQNTNYPGDGFVAKIAADGSKLLGSTYVGGRYGEGIEGVSVDSVGNVYFSGATYSDDFPVTSGAFQTNLQGSADFFAAELSPDLSHLLFSTYIGGNDLDYARTSTIDTHGNLYIAGMTQSNDWPLISPIQQFLGGNWDGSLIKFALGGPSPTPNSTATTTMTSSPVPTLTPQPTSASLITIQDDDPAVQYEGWQGVIDASASGGTYRFSMTANDKVMFRFNGTSVKWLTRRGPGYGQAAVIIDGVEQGVFDMYSAKTKSHVKRTFGGLSNSRHKIVIQVVGTKNSNSSDFGVAVDAFTVGTATTEEDSPSVQYDYWKGKPSVGPDDGEDHANGKAGARAALTFQGNRVDWITAIGPSYGIAQVLIDGADKGKFDLFAGEQRWQQHVSFEGLPDGQHKIEIIALGTKHSGSLATTVTVDAFQVPGSGMLDPR